MYVKEIQSVSLYTKADDLTQVNNYLNVITNYRDVYASIAISTLTIGATIGVVDGRFNGQMGFIGSAIKDYGYNDSNGNFQFGNLTPDFIHNAVRVSKCAFITFALNVSFGEAYAQASIFYFSKLPITLIDKMRFDAYTLLAYDKNKGSIVSHMQFLVERNSDGFIVNKVIERNIKDTCSKLDIKRKSLLINKVEKIGLKIYSGQTIDEIPKRIRKNFLARKYLS
jgi:hypothetical protein